MKNALIFLCFVLASASIQAGLVNGGITNGSTLLEASSLNVSSDLDIGWSAYASSEYDLGYGDIYLNQNLHTDGHWFGQIYTDNSQTYGSGTLSFDISYLTRSLQNISMFRYAIYGTDSTNSTDTLFSLTAETDPTGSAWTEVVSGETALSGTGSHEVSFTSSAYTYLAVRFRFSASSTPENAGMGATNFSVVPEPHTIGLLGIGCILTLLANRRISRSGERPQL